MVQASDVVLMLVALLFPPVSAAMITGCSCDLLINVVSYPPLTASGAKLNMRVVLDCPCKLDLPHCMNQANE
jgi:uncharacterized membrane protein YqaE (UPF0057 family)